MTSARTKRKIVSEKFMKFHDTVPGGGGQLGGSIRVLGTRYSAFSTQYSVLKTYLINPVAGEEIVSGLPVVHKRTRKEQNSNRGRIGKTANLLGASASKELIPCAVLPIAALTHWC